MSLVNSFSDVFAYVLGLNEVKFNNQSIDNVQKKLNKLFDGIRKSALVSYSELEYEKSFFAVCAWIDEFILCSCWEDKIAWKKNMLQQVYFNTTNAGEIFFERIEDFVSLRAEVVEVYFYCLKLGFKGKYYSANDMVLLSEKIKTIYRYIIGRYGDDFNKSLVNCVLTPSCEIEKINPNVINKKDGINFWKKFVWWAIPVLPLVIIAVVFNEVLDSLVVNIFHSLN